MKKDFTILGIESTCDETSAALLRGGNEILSNVIYSQIDEHKKYHGVVPELASRAHAAKIATVINEALGNEHIDCVAFASGPGLPGGLMVGRVAAETLANFKKVPILGVNHLEGHIFACDFEGTEAKNRLQFPLVALVVSGGHTELWYVKDYGQYKVLGKTRDDAAGEAFDKVAKLLGLAYPGGPQVSKQALQGKRDAIHFPRPLLPGTWEFSFSGIKTAVSYYLRDHKEFSVPDVCASFEQAMVDTLVTKTLLAAKKYKVRHIAVGGGVAANSLLREQMQREAAAAGIEVHFVERKLSSDNAAMIALAAYRKLAHAEQTGKPVKKNIDINPNMKVRSWD
ncbi:MAG: tRNA (adenosine(37)-N6)-threonylcarbamoyltransferase complex transferase subunit TsaD [Elusimicrobia bacterium]|nr:tRNA (adenosine(37)-N6)-threonylcarbamoyltransferase complex transferase subunit TsaD [Elusimicrobiota bacterium]MDY5729689.1 tRNA (adenosine(37)-N6)-threonylcarbamoyltransferase complex transferase subunit TsaD [Elusimicrobiaceae bacterium]